MTRTTNPPIVSMTRSAFPWQPSALLPDAPPGTPGHQDPPPAAPPGNEPPATTPPADPPADSGKSFNQAELDRIVGERLAAEQAKWQKKLEDAQALAGKNETEKLTIERDQAKARADEVTKASAQRIAQTEAKVAALSLGAKPDRVAALIKHADLTTAVDTDGNVDDGKVKAAIEKALTEFPEWKQGPATASASGGDLKPGSGSDKPTFTRAQIEAMSQDELIRRVDEINEAMADGRVTG